MENRNKFTHTKKERNKENQEGEVGKGELAAVAGAGGSSGGRAKKLREKGRGGEWGGGGEQGRRRRGIRRTRNSLVRLCSVTSLKAGGRQRGGMYFTVPRDIGWKGHDLGTFRAASEALVTPIDWLGWRSVPKPQR